LAPQITAVAADESPVATPAPAAADQGQFRIHAVYEYSSSVSLYLGYQFDSLDLSDWALVGRSVGQVLTGDIPPKYK